jgi:ubiquitin C-terminal hydrolase
MHKITRYTLINDNSNLDVYLNGWFIAEINMDEKENLHFFADEDHSEVYTITSRTKIEQVSDNLYRISGKDILTTKRIDEQEADIRNPTSWNLGKYSNRSCA